ncbi:MAG: hypothetical protein K2H68_06640, partial [Bacteroidales bacterium]|nr:hypothetical protein [Bacteroidales bacterium]
MQHYVPITEDPQTIYAYQIEMSGKCLSLAPSNVLAKDSMVVIAAEPVYISTVDAQQYCSGDVFLLSAPTNGTTVWYKQKKYSTGGYGARELVVSGWPGNKELQLTMGPDTVLYTIEARTACPDNGEASVSFSVSPKPGPKISIRDTFACASEAVTLKAGYDASVTGPISWKVDGKPVSQPYVVKSPDPSRDYTMQVEGTVTGTLAGVNDCPSSATAKIQFYSSPIVEIQGKNDKGILCVDDGAPLRIQAQGDASNEYAWYLKGNPTTPIGTGAVLNRAFDKDTLLYVVAANGGSCTAADTVRIVLYGKKRAVADTTVCMGSEFSFSMPKQQNVSYRWYAPNGTLICPCESITFYDDERFMAKDEGTYKVEIIRNGCTMTQDIDIKGYPEPVMDFGTTEDPVAFCAGNPLVLRVQPKIDGKVESGYFVWTDPVGAELLAGEGKNTYVKDEALMVDRGVYTVAVTLQNGCTHHASVNVRVDDHTQPEFSLQPYYCEGDVVDLNAVYQGDGSTYEWFNESGRHFGPAPD